MYFFYIILIVIKNISQYRFYPLFYPSVLLSMIKTSISAREKLDSYVKSMFILPYFDVSGSSRLK